MNIDDAIPHAHCVWFGDRAKAVTYNGAVIPAHVRYGENLEREKLSSSRAEATVWVEKSDVAKPVYQDKISFDDEEWTVVQIIKGDDLVWQLEVERDLRPTFKGR